MRAMLNIPNDPDSWELPGFGVVELPEYPDSLEKLSDTALMVTLKSGAQTKVVWNARRGFIIPRRWRKPR